MGLREFATLGEHCSLRGDKLRLRPGAISTEQAGIAFAVLCAINGAFVPPVAKITTQEADPLLVTVMTTWFAAGAAVAVLTVRRRLHLLFRLSSFLQLVLLGALGTSIAFMLFFTGAARATAIETLLCLQIEPVYSLLLSWLVLGVRPSLERVAATALIMGGLLIALGIQGLRVGSGTWYLLATPLCWQVSHLIVLRWLPAVGPDILAAARYVWGGLLLSLFARGSTLPSLASLERVEFPWVWVGLQGVVLSYGGTTLWYGAVTRIDLARATVLVVPTVPVLSLAASFILLGEVPSLRQFLGVLITALGVYVFARKGVSTSQPSAIRSAVAGRLSQET